MEDEQHSDGAELAEDIDAAFPQRDEQEWNESHSGWITGIQADPAQPEVTCSGGITLHPMGAQA